jgi:S-DNA-T family DNA segregation ATPase FtsK/SpoIIIE
VDTGEIEKITDFIGNQRGYPDAYHLPEYFEEGEEGKKDVDLSDRDELFEDAARMIVQYQQGSTSLLQRKMKLGYNRAGRIIDQLEAAGIVGTFEGSKAREVLIKDMTHLEQILKDIL